MSPPRREDFDPFAPDKPMRGLTPLGKLVVYGGGLTLATGGLTACALWFWRPAPQLPRLLPADTQVVLLLRPTVRALVGLPMVRRAYPEVFESAELAKLRQSLADELGIAFEQDIWPWMGTEAGVALLGKAGGRREGAAFAMAARDHAALERCLTKIAAHRTKRGDRVASRQHAGYNYRVVTPASGASWALGHVGGLALATSDEATFQALAAHGKDSRLPNLAGHAAYGEIDHALPRDAVITGWMAGGDAGRTFARNSAPPGLKELESALTAWRGAGFGLAMRSDGVEFATVASVDATHLSAETQAGLGQLMSPVAPALVDDAPGETLAALAFHVPPAARDALAAAWRDYRREAPAAAALERAGVDFEKDLLAWLPGDVGLFVMPGQGGAAAWPLDAYAAARPREPAVADEALTRIATAVDLASLGLGMAQTEEPGDGGTWRVVRERATSRVVVAYGRLGPEVRLAIGEGAYSRLTKSTSRLAANPRFQAATRPLPRPNAGLFYLDVDAMTIAAKPLLPPTASPPAALTRGLESVRAVGAASSPGLTGDGLMHASFFLHMSEPVVGPQ